MAASLVWLYKHVLTVYERLELPPALLGSAQFRRGVLTLKLGWDLEDLPGFQASASLPLGSCSISLGVWPLEGQGVHGKGTWLPHAPKPQPHPGKPGSILLLLPTHLQRGKGADEHLVGQVLR